METIYTKEEPIITSDDIAMVEKFIAIKNRGGLCDGGMVTKLYNKILQRADRPTSCGSCIRGRVQQLENWYNNYKKKLEVETEEKVVVEQPKEVNNEATKKGRPKKEKK